MVEQCQSLTVGRPSDPGHDSQPHLDADELVATGLKAFNNPPHQCAVHTVGLDHDEGLLSRCGPCGRHEDCACTSRQMQEVLLQRRC